MWPTSDNDRAIHFITSLCMKSACEISSSKTNSSSSSIQALITCGLIQKTMPLLFPNCYPVSKFIIIMDTKLPYSTVWKSCKPQTAWVRLVSHCVWFSKLFFPYFVKTVNANFDMAIFVLLSIFRLWLSFCCGSMSTFIIILFNTFYSYHKHYFILLSDVGIV